MVIYFRIYFKEMIWNMRIILCIKMFIFVLFILLKNLKFYIYLCNGIYLVI